MQTRPHQPHHVSHTSRRDSCVALQITQSKEGGGWVSYTWYRPAASTHANPTNKKYAYIMPLDYKVAGSTDSYSIGIENGVHVMRWDYEDLN